MFRHALKYVVLVLWACVVGSCGGGSSGGEGGGTFGDLTVRGTVRFPTGTPAASLPVFVAGRGPFITDEDGKFLVSDAPEPYDAIVLDGAAGEAHVWYGLTRADPVFTLSVGITDLPNSASISGTIAGGDGYPPPAAPPEYWTSVVFGVANALAADTVEASNTTGTYSNSSVGWWGPSNSTLYISALQYTVDADGMPTSYKGFGTLSRPVESGDIVSNQDISLGSVSDTLASGTVSSNTPLEVIDLISLLELPGGAFLFLSGEIATGPGFSHVLPVAPGISRGLLVYGRDLTGNQVVVAFRDLAAPTTNLDVHLPALTAAVLPVNGATDVGMETEFIATPPQDERVFRASFTPVSGSGPKIRIVTASSTFRIPDLSAHGMSLPAGAEYDWSVTGIGPATSVDDLAVERSPSALLLILGLERGFSAQSAGRKFHLAP